MQIENELTEGKSAKRINGYSIRLECYLKDDVDTKIAECKMKIYTDEIAIRANAHTNRKCINGNSMRWLVRLK